MREAEGSRRLNALFVRGPGRLGKGAPMGGVVDSLHLYTFSSLGWETWLPDVEFWLALLETGTACLSADVSGGPRAVFKEFQLGAR